MYNDYMYAVERSDEYLEHYGVKGMKWGVRKAIASGNSRKLARAYKKASRKLAKLERRANNGAKYAKRAAALGAGAAAAGGLAAVGTEGVAKGLAYGGAYGSLGVRKAGTAMRTIGQKMQARGIRGGGRLAAAGQAVHDVGQKAFGKSAQVATGVQQWGRGNSIGTAAAKVGHNAVGQVGGTVMRSGLGNAKVSEAINQAHRTVNKAKGVSNNAIARAGAASVGAGLAAGAGYNAYRAATTKRAAKKAQQWRSEMNQAFKGTQYANGGNGSRSSGSSNKNRNRNRKRRSRG